MYVYILILFLQHFCYYNRFVATLESKDMVEKGSVNVFRFDEYFHLNQTQV